MIVADKNMVSTFARVGALLLLQRLLEADRLHITPGTYHELRRAVEVGCAFLEPVLAAISPEAVLDLIELTRRRNPRRKGFARFPGHRRG